MSWRLSRRALPFFYRNRALTRLSCLSQVVTGDAWASAIARLVKTNLRQSRLFPTPVPFLLSFLYTNCHVGTNSNQRNPSRTL